MPGGSPLTVCLHWLASPRCRSNVLDFQMAKKHELRHPTLKTPAVLILFLPLPMESQIPPHGTNYSKRSEDGCRLQTRQRIIIWHVKLATKEHLNGCSRTIPSSNGSPQVHSCGFMGNVCCHFLPFPR